MGQDIPSCVQPRLLADSDITTELPKQGLKHFQEKQPAACHAMAVDFARSNMCLVPILNARRGSLKA